MSRLDTKNFSPSLMISGLCTFQEQLATSFAGTVEKHWGIINIINNFLVFLGKANLIATSFLRREGNQRTQHPSPSLDAISFIPFVWDRVGPQISDPLQGFCSYCFGVFPSRQMGSLLHSYRHSQSNVTCATWDLVRPENICLHSYWFEGIKHHMEWIQVRFRGIFMLFQLRKL